MEAKIPYLIGLTGGIGSGKSRVAARLSKQTGFFYIDADRVGKDLFSEKGEALNALRAIVGERFFLADGTLDRALLRGAIFSDQQIRQQVDELAHPLIWDIIKQRSKEIAREEGIFGIIEVPLLFESDWSPCFNKIVVVYADQQSCLARLAKRDSLSDAEAALAIAAQLPLAEKATQADHVINNSGNWLDTLRQISSLSDILMAKNT